MYSPYLYGRQSELLALRAIKNEGGDLSDLLPVIEPVLQDSASIRRCAEVFGEAGLKMVVVLNPTRYQFRDAPEARKALRNEMGELFDQYSSLIPGYTVGSATLRGDIGGFLKEQKGRPAALLYASPSLTGPDLKAVGEAGQIAYHFVLNQSASALQIAQLPKRKLVDVRDHFNKLPRNADYTGSELFTDRHLVQKSIGGIGDYTVVGRAFEVGGSKPGAVAIHASFKEPKSGCVWVEHFVSDDTDRDVGDAGSKFLQAAGKLVRAVNKRASQFGSDAALDRYRSYVDGSLFPGLGKNKEHQIHHHVRLMLECISSS